MKRSRNARGITLHDVINHITHFKQEVSDRFDKLNRKIDGVRAELSEKIDRLDRDFRAHCKGVDDLDFRVQDIEDAHLVQRVSKIEKHLGLTTK